MHYRWGLGRTGYAESAVVSYIIARARAVSNPSALARQLEEQACYHTRDPAAASAIAFASLRTHQKSATNVMHAQGDDSTIEISSLVHLHPPICHVAAADVALPPARWLTSRLDSSCSVVLAQCCRAFPGAVRRSSLLRTCSTGCPAPMDPFVPAENSCVSVR